MAKASKPKKKPVKRPDKYEEKLILNGSFEEIMKELVTPKLPLKPK